MYCKFTLICSACVLYFCVINATEYNDSGVDSASQSRYMHPSVYKKSRRHKSGQKRRPMSSELQAINRPNNFIMEDITPNDLLPGKNAVQKTGEQNFVETAPGASHTILDSFPEPSPSRQNGGRRSSKSRRQSVFKLESSHEIETETVDRGRETLRQASRKIFTTSSPDYFDIKNDSPSAISCPTGTSSTFIRIPRSEITGSPTLIRNMNVLDCSSHCMNNTHPSTGQNLSCQGFNYKDTTVPTCEFFDAAATVGPLNQNVGIRSFFFDKVCLEDAERCMSRPYAFEAIPDAMLRGNVLKSVTVENEGTCLSACLREPSFTCQSVNYDRARRICELSRFSRRNKMPDFDKNVRGVDYFENNCLTKENRCRSGSTYFVKTMDHQLNGFRISEGMHPLNTCLQKCLDENRLFCRSVEFSLNKAECHISDEDSFSEPSLAKNSGTVGIDLYEPVCLPGADDRSIRCERPFLFEKIIDTALLAPSNFRVLNGMTAEDCMMACARDTRCSSLNFNRETQTCMLSEYDRRNETATLESTLNIDYFENNCKRVANVQGCFFTLEGVGRRLRPEFTAKEMIVDKALDCKISCIEAHDSCKSISYNSHSMSCIHSNLNHKSAPFELLTLVDEGYDTYIKGDCLLGDNRTQIDNNSIDTRNPDISQFGGPQNNLQIQPTRPPSIGLESTPMVVVLHSSARGRPTIYPSRLPRKTGTDFVSMTPSSRTSMSASYDNFTAMSRECNVRLRALQRTIRPFYRSDFKSVGAFSDCQKLCEKAVDFECRSLSFSIKHKMCAMSTLTVPDYPYGVLTHFHPDYNYFLVDECTSKTSVTESTQNLDFLAPSPQEFLTINAEPSIQLILESPEKLSTKKTTEMVTKTTKEKKTTLKMMMIMPPGPKPLINHDQGQGTDLPQTVERRPLPAILPAQAQSGNQPLEDLRTFLDPGAVRVEALCTPDGVNITVFTSQSYSGAIYAAERFSFCRNLVTSQSSFWLFLPKPEINSACNTIMVNDVLSGVVVISNDQVIPYDITTKDDLFYQISCDYTRQFSGVNGAQVLITSGLVIGGPTPRVVAGSGARQEFDAVLRILRNGVPVQNVLIGEILTLSIESSMEPERMMLMSCNVSRIGGQGAPPSPLPIIDQGCPAVNQIMGPVTRGRLGLQSPLTAFRIDGSAEIQLVCMVMFCPQACAPVICGSDSGGSFNSFGRKKRDVDQLLEDMDHESVMEAVNGRLRVMVEGEKFPDDDFGNQYAVSNENCIPEQTFLWVTCLLSAIVALLMTSLGCMLCRRSWMVALQHKLIADHMQTGVANLQGQRSHERGFSNNGHYNNSQRGRSHMMTSQM